MGNTQNQEQKKTDIIDMELSHQRFVNSKLVKADSTVNVQTLIGCEEKEFERWSKVIGTVKAPAEHLLLPLEWSFSTKNICGSSGHATVPFLFYEAQLPLLPLPPVIRNLQPHRQKNPIRVD